MGLNNSQSDKANKTYLNIVGGKITRRFKTHLPEEKGKQITFNREIKDKEGNVVRTVIERYYDSLDGIITNAEIDKTGDYGAMLIFNIISDEEYTLSIPLDSSYGRSILKRIPNIDPNKNIEFSPYNFESKDEVKNGKPKKIVGCNVYQQDCGWDKDKVPMKWTLENPGSLPKWKQSEATGKWDNTEELEFLAKHFVQWATNVGGVEPELERLAEAIDAEPEIMEMEKEFALEQEKKAEAKQQPQDENDVADLPF